MYLKNILLFFNFWLLKSIVLPYTTPKFGSLVLIDGKIVFAKVLIEGLFEGDKCT